MDSSSRDLAPAIGSALKRVERIGDATLILGDCRDVLPTLGRVDAVVTDPPYGIDGTWSGGDSHGWGRHKGGAEKWDKRPAWLSKWVYNLDLPCIIWGGQYFGLMPSGSWLVWDKIVRQFTAGHCELAWTNLSKPIRAFSYSHGALATEGKEHPTQKPLALMVWCLGFIPGEQTILDPFMGSGTTGVACANLGRKFIGVEIDEGYFDIACRRVEEAYRQPRLFAEPEPKPVQDSLFSRAMPVDGKVPGTNNNPESKAHR